MKPLNLTPEPPWVEHERRKEEERFRAELEKDPTLRILYRDSADMPYIGFQVNMLGFSYYRSLIDLDDGLLKHIVQEMQSTNIPQHLWAYMQDMGVENVGVSTAIYIIMHGLNVNRSNWQITEDTYRLLELTYNRGKAIGALSLNRQLAFEAYRKGDYKKVAKYATWDQKERIVDAAPPPPNTKPFH